MRKPVLLNLETADYINNKIKSEIEECSAAHLFEFMKVKLRGWHSPCTSVSVLIAIRWRLSEYDSQGKTMWVVTKD